MKTKTGRKWGAVFRYVRQTIAKLEVFSVHDLPKITKLQSQLAFSSLLKNGEIAVVKPGKCGRHSTVRIMRVIKLNETCKRKSKQ